MIKRLVVTALVCAAFPVAAQDTEPDQTASILYSARARMMRQNDVWFKDGDYLTVIQNLEVLVGAQPRDEESWSNLVWMYMNIERADLQWLTARRFERENSEYADAKYYEAEFLYMKRQYAKIPALLETAIASETKPDNNSYRFLAHSYNKLGYYKDALRVWEAYIAKNPNDAQAKVNRDRVAERIKQIKK